MTLPAVVTAAMFVGVTIYAIVGDADFGSRFYDLTAGSRRSGACPRTLVDHRIGSVCEAKPHRDDRRPGDVVARLSRVVRGSIDDAQVPMMLGLKGIVLRGIIFALRTYANRRVGYA
jgi:cytochrome bd ubiquinol oxidase subunit II